MDAYAAEPETADGSFMETATLHLGAPPGQADGIELKLFPGAAGDIQRVPLARRTEPVEYGHGWTLMYDVTLRHIPEGVPLPPGREVKGEGWSVAAAYERHGDAVRARLEVALERRRFDPAGFPELRRFWSAVSSAVTESLWIPSGPPGSPAAGG